MATCWRPTSSAWRERRRVMLLRLKTWSPRSMMGQLLGLLLLVLLAAHGIVWLMLRSDFDTLHPISRQEVLQQIGVAVRVLQSVPTHQQADMARALSSNDVRFWVHPEPAGRVLTMDRTERQLAADIAEALAPAVRDVRVQLLRQPGQHQVGTDEENAQAVNLEVAPDGVGLVSSVALGDGQWLNASQRTVVKTQWWRPFTWSLPISTIPVLLVSFFFVRRLLRPTRALAQAAERVSRGERVEPLQVEGPHETREVIVAFNAMQERLMRFVEDRTRMLGAISHDFRTPITSLRLRAELIDDQEQRDAIVRTLDEMRRMVDETLLFSRDDAAAEATQDFDYADLLREVVSEHQAMGRPVTLSVLSSRPGRGRPLALKRAVHNLIDNAVQHAKTVHVSLHALPDGHHGIDIDDDGPGIPDAQLDEVFKPFARLEGQGRNQETGGVGLGLAIARSSIQAHGGQVALINRPEGGLRARITLP